MKYSFWNSRQYYYKYSFNFPFDFSFIFTLLTHLVAGSVWAFSLPTPSGVSGKFATQPSLIKPAILQLDFRLVGQGGRQGGGLIASCGVCCATFIKLHFRYAVTFIVLTVCGPWTLPLAPRGHGVSSPPSASFWSSRHGEWGLREEGRGRVTLLPSQSLIWHINAATRLAF